MFEEIELIELIELLASGSSVKRVVGTDVDPDKVEKFKEDAVVVDVKVVGTVEVVEIKTGVRADSLTHDQNPGKILLFFHARSYDAI